MAGQVCAGTVLSKNQNAVSFERRLRAAGRRARFTWPPFDRAMSHPTTPPEAALDLYRGAAGLAYHEGKRALRPDAVEWVLRLRAAKVQPWIPETDTVFEFGVGAGWNLARLRCARRIGCDAADCLADRLRPFDVEFLPGTREVGDARADVVICHHTLEHVLEPAAVLGGLWRILKPGGALIV